MVVVLKNNKRSVLRQLLASSDTLVVVSDSTVFPTLAVGEYFYLTILRSDGASEIVKVLSVSGASLTVVRAQEGTVAREFPVGSGVEMRVTAASVLEAAADAVDALTLGDLGITATAAELNVLDGVTATTPTLNASVSNSTQTRDTVAALLADTTLTYTAGQIGTVTAGGYVRTRAEGFSYQVAASGATNHHVITAGGVKLYVQPGDSGYSIKAFGAKGDGVTDDTVTVQTALTQAAATGQRVIGESGKTYLVFALKVGCNFDLNGCTLKKRPATASDPTMGVFTGDNTTFWIPAPSGVPAMIYCTANVTIENGVIDGNSVAETYGSAAVGSFAASSARAGIVASRSWNNVRDVEVRNITFNSVYGTGVCFEYLDSGVVTDCLEKGARSSMAFCISEWKSPFAKGGSLLFTHNTLAGPRDLGGVGDPAVFDGSTSFIMDGNYIDATTQTTSAVVKLQNMVTCSVTNNTLRNSTFTIQNNQTLPSGESMVIEGNTFTSNAPTVQEAGIQGGNGIYKIMSVSDNMFVNARASMPNQGEKFVFSNNTVLADRDCRIGGNNLFYALSANPGGTVSIGDVVVQNNTMNLGGFSRHVCFNFPPGGVDKMTVTGNRFEGADVAFAGGTTSAKTGDTAFELRIFDNEFYNNRSIGRVNAHNLRALVFSGNKCYSWNAATSDSTLVAGYSGKGMYFVVNGTTCDIVEVSKNSFYEQNLGVNDYPIWLNLGSATVGALWVLENIIQAPTPAFSVLVQPNTVNATTVVARGNWFTKPMLNQWTVTNAIVTGNSGPDTVNVVQGLSRASHALRGVTSGSAGVSAGYIEVDVAGTTRKIQIYAVS